MLPTICSDRGCTGRRSTRLFQWLERGNTGHFGAGASRRPDEAPTDTSGHATASAASRNPVRLTCPYSAVRLRPLISR
jgi:hypothetical protein